MCGFGLADLGNVEVVVRQWLKWMILDCAIGTGINLNQGTELRKLCLLLFDTML